MIKKIMEGCYLFEDKNTPILFGCPTEVLKVFLKNNIPFPRHIVLPKEFYRHGIIQADIEFPYFYVQFVLPGNDKLIVIGTGEQLDDQATIINLVTVGPAGTMMRMWGIPEKDIERQNKISNQMGFKNPDGTLACAHDVIDFKEYENNQINIGDITIVNKNDNKFVVLKDGKSYYIDLNFENRQMPPIEIRLDAYPTSRPAFGLTALTQETSGFDPLGYTSCYINWINGMPIIIDGIAWIREVFDAIGISLNEIEACILSHIHGDHSSIWDMIIGGKKVNLITKKVIYESFVLKGSKYLNLSREEIKKMINFIEVQPGNLFNYYGATYRFFDTVHNIDTIGFQVDYLGKSIIYSGDTLWGSNLDEYLNKQVITYAQYETINGLPNLDADLLIMDCGEGFIHPKEDELAKIADDKKEKIFLSHKSSVKTDDTFLDVLYPGQQWDLIIGKTIDVCDINLIHCNEILRHLTKNWLITVLSIGIIEKVHSQDKLATKGRLNNKLFIILSGKFVEIEESLELEAGDVFGYNNHQRYKTSLIAKSPGKVLRIDIQAFNKIARPSGIENKINKINQIRKLIKQNDAIKKLPNNVINKLCTLAEICTYGGGENIIRINDPIDKAIYILISGKALVLNEKGLIINQLFPAEIFGEIAIIDNSPRTATVMALNDSTVLKFNNETAKYIINELPHIYHELLKLKKSRK